MCFVFPCKARFPCIQHYPDGLSYVTSLLWHQCVCKSVQYVAWQARRRELHFACACVEERKWWLMRKWDGLWMGTVSVMCFLWCHLGLGFKTHVSERQDVAPFKSRQLVLNILNQFLRVLLFLAWRQLILTFNRTQANRSKSLSSKQ